MPAREPDGPDGPPRARVSAGIGEPPGSLWSRLTARDRRIIDLVEAHRVLTTDQLAAVEFSSLRRAQHRLTQLLELGVLWRFRHPLAGGGSRPWHWTLGYAGARLLAAQRGADPPRPGAWSIRLERLAESPTLRHLVGTNGVFTALAGWGSEHLLTGEEGLVVWKSEAMVATEMEAESYRWGSLDSAPVRPDGLGVWAERDVRLCFYLEYDTGTEQLRRLVEKVSAYLGERAHFRGERDRRVWVESLAGMVLFWLPSTRRKTALRELLVRAETGPLPIATAARDHGDPDGPAGQVWLPLPILGEIAPPSRRMRIGQLAAGIGGTEPGGQPSTLARARRRRRDHEQAEQDAEEQRRARQEWEWEQDQRARAAQQQAQAAAHAEAEAERNRQEEAAQAEHWRGEPGWPRWWPR